MPFTKNKLYVSLGTLMASGSAFAQTAYVISGVPASPLNLSSYSQVDTAVSNATTVHTLSIDAGETWNGTTYFGLYNNVGKTIDTGGFTVNTGSTVYGGTAGIQNSSGATITGSTANSINNLGIIGKNGALLSVTGIYNDGGTISNSTSNATINNVGTITGSNAGINNQANGVISNSSSGDVIKNGSGNTIGGNSTTYGIYNAGSISGSSGTSINSSGTLSGSNSGIYNATGATISSNNIDQTIKNSSTLGGSSSQYGIYNLGSITNGGTGATVVIYNNGGTIQGSVEGIYNGVGGSITSTNGSAIFNAGTISSMTNAGTISGQNQYGFFNGAAGTITTLTNTGSIIASQGGVFNNGGTITTLNNAQGAGNTNGALTYSGKLPTNYNIIINSSTNFGKLSVISSNGTTTFGIASSSTVAAQTYVAVLSGVTSTAVTAGKTGTFGSYNYLLALESGSTTVWDLTLSTPDPTPTPTPTPIPTPPPPNYVTNTAINNNPAGAGAALTLTNIAANPTAAMAPVIKALNGLTGVAQSNAISQTLPVVVGASSLATANSQRGLGQIVQARQNAVAGLSAGEDFIASRDVWMKAFGGWANQNDVNNVSGYKINTGGLAIGGDYALSPKSNIGGVLAYANSNVNGNSSAAPSSVSVNSYQLGAYGDTALREDINWNYQADFGINQNTGSRGIAFMGTTANSSYNSYSGHVGTGVQKLYPLTQETRFIPSLRVDYLTVQSQGYTETNAGALNLNVNSQTYQELLVSANLRLDHDLTDKMKVTGNVGAGYNTLNNQVQITSTYSGGGAAFATNGLQVSPWLYNAGVGIIGQIQKGYELAVRYDVQATTSGYLNQMASARLKILF